MNRLSLSPARMMLIVLLLVLPAIACNPLSGAEDEIAENASALAEGLADAVEERSDASEEDSSTNSESTSDDASTNEEVETRQSDAETSADSDSSESTLSGESDSPEDLSEALKSTLTVDAMRMHISSEDLDSGLQTEVTLAFVRPDKYQMSSEGVDLIIVGDTTYLGTPDGEWIETPANMSSTVEESLLAFVSDEAINERLDDISGDWSRVTKLGSEKINGVEVRGYEYIEAQTDQFSSLVRMWIGVEDGLLYRQEVEGNVAGIHTRTMMAFEYGDDVVIEPPY